MSDAGLANRKEAVVDVSIDVKDTFRITRWKVKAGTKISKGCLLALYETQSDKKTLKLKADKNHVGTVMEVVVQEKESVDGKRRLSASINLF